MAYSGSYAPTTEGQTVYFNVGDHFVYRLDSSSDYDTVFAYIANPLGLAKCVDVAQTVAGRQRQWDDSIVVGELYKFGQCYAICVGRSPGDEVFVSEAENEPKGGGVTIEALFRVVRPGLGICTTIPAITRSGLAPITGGPWNGTQVSHLFRVAVSTFIVDRATQIIEIGYKSTLGIRYSGMMNFRDSYSGFWSDLVSCDLYQGAVVAQGQTFNTTQLTSGTVSLPDKRYSFFRIGCRVAGSDTAFTELDINFCICSQTQQNTYNYLRLQFPSAQRWEITHLPLTGWEIRQNLYPHPLILLDSRMGGAAKTGSSNGFVFNYSGETIPHSIFTFGLPPTVPRLGDLGLNGEDAPSYVDAWGALAEQFIYEEVQSSATQPEHEIAYVNLISPNPDIPTYENIATVGLTLRSGPNFNELNQFSVYVNEGYGATHLFPEVLYIALTNEVFGAGDIVSPAQIDLDSFDYCATWTYGRRYFFDIGISDPQNIRSKGAEWAKLFLLDLSTKNGKFHLSPIAEFGRQYFATALFTSGNADTLSVSERDSQERQPIRVSVKWREERQASDLSGRGLFPVTRELTVREASAPETAPLVQIDMTEFCTSELHALDVGKMRCREQRLVTHDVTMECLPDRAATEPGAIIKIGMEVLAYEQPNNGVILADGSTTTTSGASLSDGTYAVVLWSGMTEDLEEVTITVTGGKVVGYSNCVFCIADSIQTTQTFKAQVISYNDDGNLEITASYYPLDDNGYSLLLEDWNDPSAWVIEGLLGPIPPDVPLDPPFAGVNIIGPLATVDGSSYVYIAEIDGPSDTCTYAWSGTGITFDDDTSAAPEVTFTGVGTAVLNVTATRVSDSLDRSASKTIAVTAPTGNTLEITGPDSRIGSGTVVLEAAIGFPFTTATYEWTLTGEGSIAGATTDTATLTLSGLTVGARVVNLSAVIDGISYAAIKLVTVYATEPLAIAGFPVIGAGTYNYEGILSPDLPPGWTFEWAISGNLDARLAGAATGRGAPRGALSAVNPPALLSGAAIGRGNPRGALQLPFSPLDLSPVAWWDASDSGTVATGTGGVTDWDDKSGNGWSLAQSTSGNRPDYTTAAVNGLNAVEWPSTANNDFLVSAPGTFAFDEAYFVIQWTGGSTFGGYEGLFNYNNGSGNGWILGDAPGSTGFYLPVFSRYINADNATNRSNPWSAPSWTSPCLLRAVPTSTFSTSSGVVMGMDRSNITLNRGWKGYICEVVVLSSVLSGGDRAGLETYLMGKWGI